MSLIHRLCVSTLGGYKPVPNDAGRAEIISRSGSITSREFFNEIQRNQNARTLYIVLTTFVGRGSWIEQKNAIAGFVDQIQTLSVSALDLQVVPFVAMQWVGNEREEAVIRLRKSIDELGTQLTCCELFGLLVKAEKKQISLNEVFNIANCSPTKVDAACWIDDDVELSDRTLLDMWLLFTDVGYVGAIGAKKIGKVRKNPSAKLLARAKNLTEPAMNYPHGCCLMVDFSVVKDGIPSKFASDDGFVCFELLRASDENPMHLLKIAPNTQCYHEIGASSLLDNWTRLRRMQINHLVLIASYPLEVGEYYLRHILFWDLYPIGASSKGPITSQRLKRWLLKAAHFLIFCLVGCELITRRWLNIPITQSYWGGTRRFHK